MVYSKFTQTRIGYRNQSFSLEQGIIFYETNQLLEEFSLRKFNFLVNEILKSVRQAVQQLYVTVNEFQEITSLEIGVG